MAEPPRHLTPEEIKDVIDVLPSVTALSPDIAENARAQIAKKLTQQLSELRVCPQAVPKLKKYIVQRFRRAVIQPGEPIGLATGEAVGGPATQMTLNAFHHSGSSNSATMGAKSLKELLSGGNRSFKVTTIHFKDSEMSFEEVLEMRRVLVGVTIEDLIASKEIVTSLEVDPDSGETEPILPEDRGWWYPLYFQMFQLDEELDANHYLRLRFNTDALVAYNVTLTEIASVIQAGGDVFCIVSPSHLGIIDVYPFEKKALEILEREKSVKVSGITEDNVALTYIQLIVLRNIDSFVIKGVPGITHLDPITSSAWKVVLGERPTYNESEMKALESQLSEDGEDSGVIEDRLNIAKRTWSIWVSKIRSRMSGITKSRIVDLLLETGVKVVSSERKGDDSDGRIDIVLPQGWEDVIEPEVSKTPGNYVNRLIKIDEEKGEQERKQQKEAGVKYPKIPATRLTRLGTYVHAITEGANLKKLLAHPLINPYYTISNSIHEIWKTFGIEAVMNYIIYDFARLIDGTRTYINRRYIVNVGKMMTNMGVIVPITSRGAARQQRGPLADSTFERPIEPYIKSSITGAFGGVTSTSAAIYTGKEISMGTGLPKTRVDHSIIERIEQEAGAISTESLLQSLSSTAPLSSLMGVSVDVPSFDAPVSTPAPLPLMINQPIGAPQPSKPPLGPAVGIPLTSVQVPSFESQPSFSSQLPISEPPKQSSQTKVIRGYAAKGVTPSLSLTPQPYPAILDQILPQPKPQPLSSGRRPPLTGPPPLGTIGARVDEQVIERNVNTISLVRFMTGL